MSNHKKKHHPSGWCFFGQVGQRLEKGTSKARETCRRHVSMPACVWRRKSAAGEPRRHARGAASLRPAHAGDLPRPAGEIPRSGDSRIFLWGAVHTPRAPFFVQFRCFSKLPPTCTPSCTMKKAWGSILSTSRRRVSISYLFRHTHSTSSGWPV